MTDVLRVNVWSGPRNVSTALMYAFAQRTDTRVVDEPLYAHYLRVSGADHPGRDDVLASQDSDGEAVVRDVILGRTTRPVLFLKQMAHHLVELDRAFLKQTVNVLLTRDPRGMLPSLERTLGAVTLRDTGLPAQVELLETLVGIGQSPVVLDSRELLTDPAGVLRQLCTSIGLAFDPTMLRWKPSARPEDGVWAPHWYANVHRSSGFRPYRAATAPLTPLTRRLLPECQVLFARLAERALQANVEPR